jgi:hypothetical protein
MIEPADVLEAATAHMRDRASTYDSPQGERSMGKTVQMFNALAGGDRFMTTEQGWMFMVLLKMVRSQQGEFKLDNYEDLAAYAALAAEAGEQARTGFMTGQVVEVD